MLLGNLFNVSVSLCIWSLVKSEAVSSECLFSSGKSCQCDEKAVASQAGAVLKGGVTSLVGVMDLFWRQLNDTMDWATPELAELANGDHVASTLASIQTSLNNTQDELAKVYHTMGVALNSMRHKLSSLEGNLTGCQTKPSINEPVLDSPFVTHYCGFEDWFCNYTQPYGLHRDTWYRGSGRQNTHTGPVEDHTFGSSQGHYLYIDPLKHPYYVKSPRDETTPKNRTATLTTTVLPPGEHYCLRFWYTMYGRDVATMTVYTRNASRFSLKLTEVQQMSGQVDKYWHMAEFPLGYPDTSDPFNVVIKATLHSFRNAYIYKSYGIIAIDDFYIYNTTCVSVPKCPRGSRQMTFGNQTSCYTFHMGARSWYDAVKTCRAEAPTGHLVSVNSKQEEDFLVTSIATAGAKDPGLWFTSGNDGMVEGQFRWTDTGYPEPLTYVNWSPGQPDDVNNTQQCLALQGVGNGNGYKWNDVSCDSKSAFICEIHIQTQ